MKSWQLSESERSSGAALAAAMKWRLTLYGVLANGAGAAFVVAFFIYLGPSRITEPQFEALVDRSIPAFIIFTPIALAVGRWWAAVRPFGPIEAWLVDERPANVDERTAILRYPFIWASRSAVIWLISSIAYAALHASLGWINAVGIAAMGGLGGLASCSLQYLVVERLMRPVTARALAGGAPPDNRALGVSARLTIVWMLATGVFLLGMGGLAVAYLLDDSIDETRLLAAIAFLAVNGILGGLFTMTIAARYLAGRLERLAGALERVEHGELGARVEVDDGSEVGRVQAGFNRMAEGLAERERLREAFGTYLDPDVAEHIMREGTSLEGEEVEVTAMFVDVRDFTGFAERETALVVIATLNRLFDLAVPIVHDHQGHIDKFVGDGFLAVFGAPRRQADHAAQALKAACEIARRLDSRDGQQISVGIGVNSGVVVTGNVGGAGRYDFSVIGDVVNVAARVQEATRQTGDTILASEHTMRAAAAAGLVFDERPGIELKGKRDGVAVYAVAVGGQSG